MKIFIITLICGLLGYAAAKPLESSSNDATDALVEIEKQRLIKFPEELDDLRGGDAHNPNKNDEAKRILEEIEKINQALGYVKKIEHARTPAILDSSQYLFPNTGYQPFHVQNPQITGSHGETLLLPSIRSVKFDEGYHHKASDYNKPPVRKVVQKAKVTTTAKPTAGQTLTKNKVTTTAKPSIGQALTKPNTKTVAKPTITKSGNKQTLYFHPQRVEVPAPQTVEEKKLLPTHFVIPVRLYKHNKQQYVEKNSPQEYKVKGYRIVGDIDHFYGKTKHHNKTATATKVKSAPKYHLLFLPQQVMAKNSDSEIEAMDDVTNTNDTSLREEKLANRPVKLQTNTQTTTNGNVVNSTSSATIVRKRIKPLRGEASSVMSVTSSSVINLTPAPATVQHVQQVQQPAVSQSQLQQQPQYQKPGNARPTFLNNQQLTTATGSGGINANNENNNINGNGNTNKNRPFLNPLLGLQSNIQSNINNINNATSTAIKNAFQNIFRLPFRPENNKPIAAATEYPFLQTPALQLPPKEQQLLQDQQQQYYYTLVSPPANNQQQQPSLFVGDQQTNYQSDHLDSDYKWDDENSSPDCENTEEAAQEKFLPYRQPIKEMQDTQKEALRQGGIIIQKLKVRKGGIAIAGPGGVATAGSGGTAIVGPGGYALTHPRSLTIAGPGTKIIAIPANVDLKDALSRTNLKTQMIPREGRIVATGPTVYYAPGTIDGVEIED